MEATAVVTERLPAGSATHDGMGVRVTVVIPALNEADNLPHVLPRIPRWVHEVLIIDGNSSDGTVAVAESLLPQVRVVQQSGRGKGNALRAGFASATGDLIVMLDADGSMNPQEIPLFVGATLCFLCFTSFNSVLFKQYMPWWVAFVGLAAAECCRLLREPRLEQSAHA